MDSEADIYELLTELETKQRRFIVRSGQDRLVADGHLEDAIACGQVLMKREVDLSRRKAAGRPAGVTPPRKGRLAQLEVTASRVSLQRPNTCTSEYPPSLSVNVVSVREISPPEGEKPVEWILFTSEPISSETDVAAIVDGYRRRWLIEEYFKAIKTGCSYESSRA